VTFLNLVSCQVLPRRLVDDSDVVTNGFSFTRTLGRLRWRAERAGFCGSKQCCEQQRGYETLNEANGYPQGSLSTNYWNILRGTGITPAAVRSSL
jgi:hypothetical protein